MYPGSKAAFYSCCSSGWHELLKRISISTVRCKNKNFSSAGKTWAVGLLFPRHFLILPRILTLKIFCGNLLLQRAVLCHLPPSLVEWLGPLVLPYPTAGWRVSCKALGFRCSFDQIPVLVLCPSGLKEHSSISCQLILSRLWVSQVPAHIWLDVNEWPYCPPDFLQLTPA